MWVDCDGVDKRSRHFTDDHRKIHYYEPRLSPLPLSKNTSTAPTTLISQRHNLIVSLFGGMGVDAVSRRGENATKEQVKRVIL